MNTQEQTQLNTLRKALMQSQHAWVIAQCDGMLASLTSPAALREARYCKAVAYRLSGQPDRALDDLQLLVTDFPDYGRAYQEQGYCYQRQGDDQNATHPERKGELRIDRRRHPNASEWRLHSELFARPFTALGMILAGLGCERTRDSPGGGRLRPGLYRFYRRHADGAEKQVGRYVDTGDSYPDARGRR